jgi:stage II sporulation protein D
VALSERRQLDAVTFRQRLGYARVRSLDFEVEALPGRAAVRITGRGYGHGAGLCQWGAKVAAQAGWDYLHILEHYYPGTELQQLY